LQSRACSRSKTRMPFMIQMDLGMLPCLSVADTPRSPNKALHDAPALAASLRLYFMVFEITTSSQLYQPRILQRFLTSAILLSEHDMREHALKHLDGLKISTIGHENIVNTGVPHRITGKAMDSMHPSTGYVARAARSMLYKSTPSQRRIFEA